MTTKSIQSCTVAELKQLLSDSEGSCLIDVREFPEHQAEHIEGSELFPLSSLSKNIDELKVKGALLLICRTGKRASRAAGLLSEAGIADLKVVAGGIKAWKDEGYPVVTGEETVWSLERQVRFTAGFLVLTGVLLSLIVHPYWIGLSAFVGAGLMFAAITDTCGMAMLLARMPWNRSSCCK